MFKCPDCIKRLFGHKVCGKNIYPDKVEYCEMCSHKLPLVDVTGFADAPDRRFAYGKCECREYKLVGGTRDGLIIRMQHASAFLNVPVAKQTQYVPETENVSSYYSTFDFETYHLISSIEGTYYQYVGPSLQDKKDIEATQEVG